MPSIGPLSFSMPTSDEGEINTLKFIPPERGFTGKTFELGVSFTLMFVEAKSLGI